MESKVKELLFLKYHIAYCAYRRQVHIDTGDFQMAMYQHFMYLDYAEQVGAIMLSMKNKERADYFQAMLCWDYK
jgi:hypothetical protein